MSCHGELVHGEAYIDGNASTGIALTLYRSGETTERTLASDEYLNIYAVHMQSETGGDLALLADSDAAGRRILIGNYAANGGVDKEYVVPYTCPRGVVPKFFGAATGRNTCIIEGTITKA